MPRTRRSSAQIIKDQIPTLRAEIQKKKDRLGRLQAQIESLHATSEKVREELYSSEEFLGNLESSLPD